MKNLAQSAQSVAFYALAAALIVTPIFFLPLTTDFYAFNKQALFIILTAVILLAWLVRCLSQKTVRLTVSPLLLPLALFAATVVVSTLLSKINHVNAWLGRSSLYLAVVVFYFIGISILQTSRQARLIINGLITSAVILALLGILAFTQALANTGLPAYLTNKQFTPAGSPLTLVSFLIITLPLALVLAFKTRSGPKKLSYFLASGVIISAITIIGSAMLSADQSVFTLILLPKLAGWSIAIDSFKTSAIFGTGPASFLSVFTQFKPLFLNRLDNWALNFGVSSNEYLHLMTTLGLVGIATIGLIIAALFKLAKREPGTRITANQLAVRSALAATALLGLFVPFSPLIWITLAGYLVLSTALAKAKNSPKIKDVILTVNAITVVDPDAPTPVAITDRSNLMPWILAIPISAGLIFLTLLASRAYAAEYIFKKSLDAARENRGGETYNLQIAALQKNPNLDRYRLAYSNTNFALANALAGQKELTDQDKQTISQLIQQAIREAKLATQLNPQIANNWRNLANLYRNLVNFADGADQFAIASYIRAIQLDPANPLLRVELGGLFYGLQRYDEAINNFQQSVQLKPDYANGYYNLSAAYKADNKILEAYQAMQQVVALLEPGSEEAQKAQQDLADLKAQLPPPAQPSAAESKTKPGGTLSAPEEPPAAPKDLQGAIEVEEPEIPSPSPRPSPQTE